MSQQSLPSPSQPCARCKFQNHWLSCSVKNLFPRCICLENAADVPPCHAPWSFRISLGMFTALIHPEAKNLCKCPLLTRTQNPASLNAPLNIPQTHLEAMKAFDRTITARHPSALPSSGWLRFSAHHQPPKLL